MILRGVAGSSVGGLLRAWSGSRRAHHCLGTGSLLGLPCVALLIFHLLALLLSSLHRTGSPSDLV